LLLKAFVVAVPPLYAAIVDAQSEVLVKICEVCHPQKVQPTLEMINEVINEDVKYEKAPLDLRNQRTYAIKVCYLICLLVNLQLPTHNLGWCKWTS
jgi:DNA mismatch repair protein MSH4